MVWLVADLIEAISTFGSVAATDPVAAVLLLVAVVVLTITFGVTGGLVLGGLANLLTGWP
jgi:uncharacterized membrane protein YtjA (UPF0391 family)